MILFQGKIWKRYESTWFGRRPKSVLSGVDIVIEKGKLHLLIGEIGLGKSTLLKIISGLEAFETVPFHPVEDTITLNDIAYMGHDIVYSRSETVHRLLQERNEMYNLFDMTTCLKILEEFQISPKEKLINLSDGQKRLVAFAVCISLDRKVYLLDEPFSNIDVNHISQMNQWLISKLDGEKTFIIATHRIHEVELLAERVIWIHSRWDFEQADADSIRDEYASSIEEVMKNRGSEK